MRILFVTLLLTLPACTSSPTKTQDTDFYSALSPKPVASFHGEFTESDQEFFQFLRSCLPNPGRNDILINSAPFKAYELVETVKRLLPGGFLFVEGDDPRIYQMLKSMHLFRLPFRWKTYEVYRKRWNGVSA